MGTLSQLLTLYLSSWRNIFNFQGRASREEFWLFWFVGVAFAILFWVVVPFLPDFFGIVSGVFKLVELIAITSLGWRRMHDINESGWWFFAPFANLIFALTQGDTTANKYGQPPVL